MLATGRVAAFPKASQITAVLAAARAAGATRIKIGDFEADLDLTFQQTLPARKANGKALLDKINREAPLPSDEDPIDVIRRQNGHESRMKLQDALDVVASGGKLTSNDNPDPTAPQSNGV